MIENRQFLHRIIITMILTTTHDSAIRWAGLSSSLGGSLLDDVRARRVAGSVAPLPLPCSLGSIIYCLHESAMCEGHYVWLRSVPFIASTALSWIIYLVSLRASMALRTAAMSASPKPSA